MPKLAVENSSLSDVELLSSATGPVGIWGKIQAHLGESGLVAAAALLAIIVGVIFKASNATDPIFLRVVGLPGTLWLNGLKLVVLPMIFTNMITSIANLKDLPDARQMGGKTICYFLVTTITSTMLGLLMVAIFIIPNVQQVDMAALPSSLAASYAKSSTNFQRNLTVYGGVELVLLGMVPPNIVAAAASNNLLGVIFFGIVVGFYVERDGHLMQLSMEINQVLSP